MKNVKVTPLAFESFGVRSMCTLVETPDITVLVDAGASLGPRFAMLPHPEEYETLKSCRSRITDAAEKADIVTVSHYHNDHHTPNYTDTVWIGSSPEEAERIYRDKLVISKDIRNNINFTQRRRGWMFQRALRKVVKRFEVADGRTFEFGATKIVFSNPVPHGESDGELGWVVMLTVERNEERAMHTSDVQGPIADATVEMIASQRPDILIVGGPPLYLSGYKVDAATIDHSLENFSRASVNSSKRIIDHHFLRGENWREYLDRRLSAIEGHVKKVITAAELIGRKNSLLESGRKRLYESDPPSQEFLKWTKMPRAKRRLTPPPI